MANGHRIRLRGWNEIVNQPDGRQRFARRFGSPRILDPSETVWLICENLPDPTTITVNGTELTTNASGPFAADITKLFQLRNEVWFDTAGLGELGELALEFRASVRG